VNKIDYVKFLKELDNLLSELITFLIKDLRTELKGQGYVNSGKLYESMELEIKATLSGSVALLKLENYYHWVDQGVKAENIPFGGSNGGRNRRSGKKGKSKFIEALIKFWKSKGLSETNSKKAAFATARKQKKEGRPTQASYRFAPNGRRLKFFTDTVDDNKNTENFEGKVIKLVERKFDNIFSNFEKSIK
jgi:hypothetical protein